MSLDLFQDQNEKHLEQMPITTEVESSAWDGFLPGTAKTAMRSFAEAGRALSLAGSVAPIAYDAFTGGTEMQDRYFKFHDDYFGDAVKYWTPPKGSVGMAGEVAGTLLGTLPLVIASPGAAVAKTQLSSAEDLTRAGVDSARAQAVGGVQAAGLGLGVWLPILGGSLATRVMAGGAGANVGMGIAERAVSGKILEGTPAEGAYEAFDPKAITLDALLGAAFGTLAHVSPEQRAQGAQFWKRMEDWGKKLKPEDVDAIATLRQAQHMDADSLPGKPADIDAVNAHHDRMSRAVDQLLRDEPVRVDDLPEAKIDTDTARIAESESRMLDMQSQAKKIGRDEGVVNIPEIKSKPAEPVDVKSDPLTDAAVRFAEENADLRIPVGKNARGDDVSVTPKQLLSEADANIKTANENARLFKTAAACLMGLI